MLLGHVFVSFSLHTCLNSTIVDLRLNENKIRSVHYSSLSRFGNLTYLNLTKNDISYVEDGAFSAQFNLQVGSNIIYIVYRQLGNAFSLFHLLMPKHTMEEVCMNLGIHYLSLHLYYTTTLYQEVCQEVQQTS